MPDNKERGRVVAQAVRGRITTVSLCEFCGVQPVTDFYWFSPGLCHSADAS